MPFVHPDRQAVLRCLYESHRVPVELIARATRYSPGTIERLIRTEEWAPTNSVDTLYLRFIDVLQNCLDEMDDPQSKSKITANDARIRLLQNLAKALETTVTVTVRLREANAQAKAGAGASNSPSNFKGMGRNKHEQDAGSPGSVAELDETLARLADRLAANPSGRNNACPDT